MAGMALSSAAEQCLKVIHSIATILFFILMLLDIT